MVPLLITYTEVSYKVLCRRNCQNCFNWKFVLCSFNMPDCSPELHVFGLLWCKMEDLRHTHCFLLVSADPVHAPTDTIALPLYQTVNHLTSVSRQRQRQPNSPSHWVRPSYEGCHTSAWWEDQIGYFWWANCVHDSSVWIPPPPWKGDNSRLNVQKFAAIIIQRL